MLSNIHKTAKISNSVKIGKGVSVGAYSTIEGNVKIGDETIIKNFVVIEGEVQIGSKNYIDNNVNICGPVKIGNNCQIWTCVSIGYTTGSEELDSYDAITIDDDCLIKEHVVISK